MNRSNASAVPLGELIVAFFDIAAQYSTDPLEITHLASKAVLTRLRRACKMSPASMSASLIGAGPRQLRSLRAGTRVALSSSSTGR